MASYEHATAIIEDLSFRVLLSVIYSSITEGEPLSHVITRTSAEQIDKFNNNQSTSLFQDNVDRSFHALPLSKTTQHPLRLML